MAAGALHTPSQQLVDDAIEMLSLCASENDQDQFPTPLSLWSQLDKLYVRWGRRPAPHRGAIDYLAGRVYVVIGPDYQVKVTASGRQALEYHRSKAVAR
jgi:hypothetical protein